MTAGRTFISYGAALRISRAVMGAVEAFAGTHVGWADQRDSAVESTRAVTGRMAATAPHRSTLSAEAAAAIAMQIGSAACSAGKPLVSCEHVRSPAMVDAGIPLPAGPMMSLCQADPFFHLCAACFVLPDVQKSVAALLPAYPDECDRCGGGGPLTIFQIQSGSMIFRYASCERCVNAARRTAFGTLVSEPS